MFVTSVVAPFLGVNCYIAAATDPRDQSAVPGDSPAPCVLIDAGLDAAGPLENKLRDLGLEPAAVLLTHGHPDHVLGLPDVLARWNVPAYLAAADHWWLDDPAETLGPELSAMMRQALGGRQWSRPRVAAPAWQDDIRLAGLSVRAISAPGHTEGSTLWRIRAADGGETVADAEESGVAAEEHIFTGDVLFASGVGRTDLAGGDQAVMDETLSHVIPALPRDAAVHPGHGPSSTVGRELATNPFLIH